MEEQDQIIKLREAFAEIFKYDYETRQREHPPDFRNNVTKIIPEEIRKLMKTKYRVEGKVGQIKWSFSPWVAIFNKNITESAQRGVYIVYLLSENAERLYLTLNQGCEQIEKMVQLKLGRGNTDETLKILRETATQIQSGISQDEFNTDSENVNLGGSDKAKKYQAGTIFYKEYSKDNLPEEGVLESDLNKMLEIYDYYADHATEFPVNYEFPEDSKYRNHEGKPNSYTITQPPASPAVAEDKPTYIKKYQNTKDPRNRIIYGAPGTGKSYKLEREKDALLGERKDQGCERVTFHPDYSYANFVGTYKPVPVKEDGKKAITYQYVPGPFMRLYVKAIKDPSNPYLLIIEEINRAMVAAVFGDIFQLLDRNKDFESEYPVSASEDIKQYLLENDVPEAECEQLKLPSNLFIWATMNSADQGVFPLDTAFKRRWEFEYLDINSGEDKIEGAMVNLKTSSSSGEIAIKWNKLRKAINDILIECEINEDKLLGPFFISPNSIKTESGEGNPDTFTIDQEKFMQAFKNKVLMYLFDDAAKQKRGKIFRGCWDEAKTFSAICKKFDEEGLAIFPQDLKNKVTE